MDCSTPGLPDLKPWIVKWTHCPASAGELYFSPRSTLLFKDWLPSFTTQRHFYSNFHCYLLNHSFVFSLFVLFLYCADHSHEHSYMLLFLPSEKSLKFIFGFILPSSSHPTYLVCFTAKLLEKLSVLIGSDISPSVLSWAFSRFRRWIRETNLLRITGDVQLAILLVIPWFSSNWTYQLYFIQWFTVSSWKHFSCLLPLSSGPSPSLLVFPSQAPVLTSPNFLPSKPWNIPGPRAQTSLLNFNLSLWWPHPIPLALNSIYVLMAQHFLSPALLLQNSLFSQPLNSSKDTSSLTGQNWAGDLYPKTYYFHRFSHSS